MYKVTLFLLFLCLSINVYTQSEVEIAITGMKTVKGNIYMALCADESQFDEKEEPYIGHLLPVNDYVLIHTLELPEGEYALLIYHDENENGKLDKNVFGMPKERYGFSNNEFGPHGSKPKFEKALFKVGPNELVEIDIQLRR